MSNKENERLYESLKIEIDVLFHNKKDYQGCLEKTKEFLKLIKKNKADNVWFRSAYLTLSKAYNRLGNKNSALTNVLKAKKYSKGDIITKKILIDWQIGMCYKDINNSKAIAFFQDCYERSASIENYEYMGLLLEEIALLKENVLLMQRAIVFYNLCQTLEHIDKKIYLDSMYENLFNLYVKHDNIPEALHTIHSISDRELAKKMKLKVFNIA